MKALWIPLRVSVALTLFAFALTTAQAQERSSDRMMQNPVGSELPDLNERGFSVLYDQTAGTTDNGYLAFYDLDEAPDWITQAADDFVVPEGDSWDIYTVIAQGFYLDFINPTTEVHVYFYANGTGNQPGAEVASYLSLMPTDDTEGIITVDLPDPVTLAEGTYWVSVQPVRDYFADGRWFWRGETSSAGTIWHWREGGSYGSGCDVWTPAASCFSSPDPSLSFIILGEHSVSTDGDGDGMAFDLFQNYPNPFAGETTVSFALPVASHVSIEVLDVTGRRVALLVDDYLGADTNHSVTWNANGIASGVYFYRMQADGFSKTLRTTLVR